MTADCWALMKIIKSALRNRLYIETLDALMTISMLGARYAEGTANCLDCKEDCNGDCFFDAALDHWEGDCLRNPNKARWGNNSAAKSRLTDVRNVVPESGFDAVSEPTECEVRVGEPIDKLADAIEEQAGLVPAFGAAAESHGDCDDRDYAGITPFKPTTDFLITAAPAVQRGEHPGSGQALVGLWSGSGSGASQHAHAKLPLQSQNLLASGRPLVGL